MFYLFGGSVLPEPKLVEMSIDGVSSTAVITFFKCTKDICCVLMFFSYIKKYSCGLTMNNTLTQLNCLGS